MALVPSATLAALKAKANGTGTAPTPQPSKTYNPATGATSAVLPTLKAMANGGATANPAGPNPGALNYNTATSAQKSAMENNWNRLNTDSAYLGSELERAQQVKAANAAKGLDTTEQDNYITKLSGISAGGGPMSTSAAQNGTPSTSNPAAGYLQQLRDLAAQNAQSQAYDARNQADATNLDNTQRLNEILANRGLGSSGENVTAQLQQAAQRANSLNSINNNLDTNLNNLDINLAQQLQQQYNLDADRAIQLGQLLGSYNGQRTLAGQAQDWGQGIDVANLTGNFNGQRTLAGIASDQGIKNDNLNAALQVGNQTGFNVTPQTDWAGLFHQVSSGTNSQGNPLTRSLAGQSFDLSEQQRTIDNNYRQEQANINNAYQQGQLSLQQAQEARLQLQQDYDEAYRRYGIQNGSGSGNEYKGLTPNQVLDSIQRNYRDENGKIPAANKQAVYEAIIDAGLTDAQTDQLLAVSGLSKKEIEAFNKQFGVGE